VAKHRALHPEPIEEPLAALVAPASFDQSRAEARATVTGFESLIGCASFESGR